MSDDKTSLKQVVSNYLRKYPEFLLENPDVLQAVRLGHDSGPATSLIERQVQQLRESNQDLTRQLNRLVQIASENERLMSRLHRLTLELTALSEDREFFRLLGERLLNDFNADILQLCLFDDAAAERAGEAVVGVEPDDPALEPFRSYLEKGATVCGRLGDERLEFLFDNKAQWVQSAALVPIGERGSLGMMAIGSSDPARFYPGMGTLFLDLLAEVIATRLERSRPEAQRRSA